ncbi:MAG: Ldh family oxidoreductase [Candidatus Eremiobacteraeota bacterium]|nr:Ldh family oxidoreductase [Candidatus Eremiobacteraeota bacterium]
MAIEAREIVNAYALRNFCAEVFQKMGVSEEDSRITADILVLADLRGVNSHGVARLKRYVDGLKNGVMLAQPDEKVVKETKTTAVIEAGSGLGQPVSKRAMQKAIDKANDIGIAFVTVRNSNHYGIAGYYSMMALDQDMIGISMTNTEVLVVPTFGKDALLGTNPISVAIPAAQERPYVLDMATSVVPRGKIEVYNRLEKPLPLGWVTDTKGNPSTDAGEILENFESRAGGGLLPLGGAGEYLSGHKGYGMMLLVEMLTGILSGSAFADKVYPKDDDGNPLPANLGHFFGAMRIDYFRDLDEFKADMDTLIRKLKNSNKSEGQSRIYIHGEKEFEKADKYRKEGIPLHPKVAKNLKQIADELDVEYKL